MTLNLEVEHIKEASLNDVDKLKVLINSAYRGETSKKGWTTEADLLGGIRIDKESLKNLLTAKGSLILKYTESGTILGCVNLVAKENILYLGMLTVSPTEQQNGIGKKLLNASESYAQLNGFQEIEMTVISKRSELIEYYKRRGFQETGEKRPFPKDELKFGKPKTDIEFTVLKKAMNK